MSQLIPIKKIQASPTNPRKSFDLVKLEELAASIKSHGLIQAITVRETKPGEFQCVCGERRLRASVLAGSKAVECNVVKLTDVEVMELQAIENDQRADVLHSERAAGYRQLIDAGRTVAEVAAKVGRSESWVSAVVRLNDLPPEAMHAMDSGDLPPSVGDLIARVPGTEARAKVSLLVLSGKRSPDEWGQGLGTPLNVRQTKALISDHFCRQLKGGPFDSKDPTLPPGSCKDCKKRAGNAGPEYKDTRADVCLDVQCFNEKARVSAERGKASAEKDGVKILDAKTAKLAFPHGEHFDESAGFFSLDKELPWDLANRCKEAGDKSRTLRELLGDEVAGNVEQWAAYSPGGYRHNLIKKTEAKKLIDAILPKPEPRKVTQETGPTEWEVKREARKVFAEEVGRAFSNSADVKDGLMMPVIKQAGRIMFGLIFRELSHFHTAAADIPEQVFAILPEGSVSGTPERFRPENPWDLAPASKTADVLLSAVVSGVAYLMAQGDSQDNVPEFRALIGRGMEEIEKEVRKRLAEEMKAKAKADKKTKKGGTK